MDLENSLLMMPGPISVSPRVLRAMSKPMINHRSTEFAGMYTDWKEILSNVFQTKNDIVVINGSDTAGMEAAVGSLAGNGDKVVAIENGKFGERLKDLAALYAEAVPAVFEWGTSVDLEVVKEKLEGGAKAIEVMKGVKKRPYYNDLLAYVENGNKSKPETPYTPAIPLFYALQEALHILKTGKNCTL